MPPGHAPLHRLGDEMGDDQDQDGEQDARSPQEQLVAPVSGGASERYMPMTPYIRRLALVVLPRSRRISSQ